MSSFHRRLVYMRKNSLKKLPQLDTLFRGAWHNWDCFVTAAVVYFVGFTVQIPCADDFKIYILCSTR